VPAEAPLNPIPGIVWLLALPLIALELWLSLTEVTVLGGPAADGLRQRLLLGLAFIPDMLRAAWLEGYVPPEVWRRTLSYPLIHGSFTHMMFAMVILLALGKFVGEAFRWWAVLVIVVSATFAGAVAAAMVPFVKYAIFGGYPPVYGLIGAFTFVLWQRARATGQSQARAFSMIGFLLGVQVVYGLAFGGGTEWVADLAGFATGFAVSVAVNPSGWAALVAGLRGR
jgi:membrane associated rhomboid family serine protease